MGFVADFIRFPAVQKFCKSLTFDKVTESLQVGTFFLRHSVYTGWAKKTGLFLEVCNSRIC